ncbi:DUF1801 domain-containing protein [Joostella atrarenae]|uniref:DUF1801 domain-containing protein n=1 Tax=Joostella atrarenae TaxID=679257 RepID=A0ABS9J521_9FLAO|nr:DUF1801 domain-containing protein [Joostella atrarenae]MCF8715499.1 DUF1801 domain-containing protein [Joostella atrarenae]
MTSANTVEDYLNTVPLEIRPAFNKLRAVILDNLPKGLEERLSYGMIGYVVPHSIYPKGYHCNPELPLPFINLASQKNYISLYHSGLYADEEIYKWFINEYPKYTSSKLDIGKSCVRFRKMDQIPYELIATLLSKMDVETWIGLYEETIK